MSPTEQPQSSMSREQLEQASGALLSRQHVCEANELPSHLQVYRVMAIDGEAQAHWELYSLWLANADDVASGEAESEGELLNLSSIKIHFCPFCGQAMDL